MLRTVLCAAVFLVSAAMAHAEILPSFDLSHAARAASGVIVVEGGKVVEVWAGELKAGATFTADARTQKPTKVVYGFAGFADAQVDQQLAAKGRKRVAELTGKRMVHFLPPDPPNAKDELFANYHEYRTVWIEDGQAFAIQQWHNPGPANMRPLDMSEAELKQAVSELRAIDAKLQALAEDEADPAKRAQALVNLLTPDARLSNEEVEQAIRQCGPAAWPAIEARLASDEHLPIHTQLIYLAHHVARRDAAETFQRILAADLAYFAKLDAAGQKYDRTQLPHRLRENRHSSAQWAIDSQ